MARKLLATTALASILATGAFAQSTTPAPSTTEPAMTTPAAPMAPAGDAASNSASSADIAYMERLGTDQHLASDITDMDVYASADANAEEAGEIENLVVAADGTVKAVVIDTGAYLGDQAKTVAVPFNQIEWSMGQNNEPRAVLTASREQLTSAPSFVSPTEAAANSTGGAAGTMAPAAGTAGTAPATGSMAANGGAMAPGTTTGASTAMSSSAMAPNTTNMAGPGASEGGYLTTVGAEEYLSSNLIGEAVRSGPNADAERIGEINDLIVASSGRVEGVVVGVGGFLGIGEKDVAVPFDSVAMSRTAENEPLATLVASRDQLTNAPSFEDDDATATAANTAPATGEAMPSTMASGAATGTAGMAAGTAAGTGMAANTATTGTATDSTSTASTGGAQPMNAGSPISGAELSADNLMGTSVMGPDNQTIGSIGDLALTPEGQVDAVIVDVGGFLGIGAKPVAVAMDNLQFMRDSGGSLTLTTQFTQDQLRNAPEYNRDTYAQDRDTMRVTNPSDIPATTQAQ